MTNKKIIFVCLIGGLIFLSNVFGAWFFVYAPETRLQLVDGKSGKPIPGANAVLMWRLTGGMEGGTKYGPMEILEAESDNNGWVIFPSWGPRLKQKGSLGFHEPVLFILHKSYEPKVIFNDYQNSWTPWIRKFLAHSNGVVALDTFNKDIRRRIRRIDEQLTQVGIDSPDIELCFLNKIPKTVTVWHEEIEGFKNAMDVNSMLPRDPYFLIKSKFCDKGIEGVSE